VFTVPKRQLGNTAPVVATVSLLEKRERESPLFAPYFAASAPRRVAR
jgi:hypothetical protein